MKMPLTVEYIPGKETVEADASLFFVKDVKSLIQRLSGVGLNFSSFKIYSLSNDQKQVIAWFVPVPANDSQSLALIHKGGGVYIPGDSELNPVTHADELEAFKLRDYLVFVPGFGFFSFDKEDGVGIRELIEINNSTSNWKTPEQGISPPLKLSYIGLEITQDPNEVIASMSDGIGDKDVEDLLDKKSSKSGALDKLADKLKMKGLKGESAAAQAGGMLGGALLKGVMWATSQVPASNTGGATWINRLEDWAMAKFDNLMKEREKSLDRLLDLLEKNPDEGLQYALPINGDEAPRGIAAPSSALSRRNPIFSSGANSSGPTDFWNMGDDHYFKLQEKYRELARQEIAKGNWKRAAYIYSTLLNDLESAASVLRQGKLYHEAAVIYKNKLKKPVAAAECFEEGGLLKEAVKIYLELKDFEKSGDLYKKMDLHSEAEEVYRKAVEQYIQKNRVIKAAEILEEKIHSTGEALELLEKSWPYAPEAKRAKMQKFALLKKYELHEEAQQDINRLLNDRKYNNYLQSLNLLVDAIPQYDTPDFAASAREASLIITAESLDKLDIPSRQKALEIFIKLAGEDELFARDCNLLLNQLRSLNRKIDNSEHGLENHCSLKKNVSLSKDIQWLKSLTLGTEVYLAGIAKDKMVVQQFINYNSGISASWDRTADELYGHLIFDYKSSDDLIILSMYGQKPFEMNCFDSSHSLAKLNIGTPDNLPKDTISLSWSGSNPRYALRFLDNNFVVDEYKNGSLRGSDFINLGNVLNVKKVLSTETELIFVSDNELCIKPYQGISKYHKFDEEVEDIVISPPRTRKRIFVCLKQGVIILSPQEGTRSLVMAREIPSPEVLLLRNGLICIFNQETGKGLIYRSTGVSFKAVGQTLIESGFLQLQQGLSPSELLVLYTNKLLVYKLNYR